MTTISPPPGFTIGALATASGTDFVDASVGLATDFGGIAGRMATVGCPSQSGVADNPIASIDNNPTPRANEV